MTVANSARAARWESGWFMGARGGKRPDYTVPVRPSRAAAATTRYGTGRIACADAVS